MVDKKFDIENVDSRLSAVYTSDQDKEAAYDQWANSYETDLVNDLGYVAHIDAASIFSKVFGDTGASVLDVACGTGLVGEELKNLGYTNVDGTDFSQEMLKVSDDRKVYQRLFQHDFTASAVEQGIYDALICVGMFAFSLPKICHMIHVINMVSPGGLCVITVNGAAWTEKNLDVQVKEESRRHGFCVEQIIEAGYIRRESIDSRVLVIRRSVTG